jgi:hypothetical protein
MARPRKQLIWNEFLGQFEKECARCHELWPADEEFFHKNRGAFHAYCRACVTERKQELRGTVTVRKYAMRGGEGVTAQ